MHVAAAGLVLASSKTFEDGKHLAIGLGIAAVVLLVPLKRVSRRPSPARGSYQWGLDVVRRIGGVVFLCIAVAGLVMMATSAT
jgi:hypothetical protein